MLGVPSEGGVGRVADHGLGHRFVAAVVDRVGDAQDVLAPVDQADRPDPPLSQFHGDRLPDATASPGDDGHSISNVHGSFLLLGQGPGRADPPANRASPSPA